MEIKRGPSITHPCLKWEDESTASTHHSWQGVWQRKKKEKKWSNERGKVLRSTSSINDCAGSNESLREKWRRGNLGIDLNISFILLLCHDYFHREPNNLLWASSLKVVILTMWSAFWMFSEFSLLLKIALDWKQVQLLHHFGNIFFTS